MKRTRTSQIITEAESRAAALRSIETQLDFGKSLSMRAYTTKIDEARQLLAQYNTGVAQLDSVRNALMDVETDLSELSSRILKAVLVQFGPDSHEYEMAGGTRRSERKRGVRRNDGPTSTPPATPNEA